MPNKNLSDRQLAFAGPERITSLEIRTNHDQTLIVTRPTYEEKCQIYENVDGSVVNSQLMTFHELLDHMKTIFDEKGFRR